MDTDIKEIVIQDAPNDEFVVFARDKNGEIEEEISCSTEQVAKDRAIKMAHKYQIDIEDIVNDYGD